jgi:hypothetical protein
VPQPEAVPFVEALSSDISTVKTVGHWRPITMFVEAVLSTPRVK